MGCRVEYTNAFTLTSQSTFWYVFGRNLGGNPLKRREIMKRKSSTQRVTRVQDQILYFWSWEMWNKHSSGSNKLTVHFSEVSEDPTIKIQESCARHDGMARLHDCSEVLRWWVSQNVMAVDSTGQPRAQGRGGNWPQSRITGQNSAKPPHLEPNTVLPSISPPWFPGVHMEQLLYMKPGL